MQAFLHEPELVVLDERHLVWIRWYGAWRTGSAEIFSVTTPLMLIGMLIGQASSATAAEEQHGTMDLLLANPISRVQVVLAKGTALLINLMAATSALALALILGGLTVGLHVSPAPLLGSAAMVAVLATPFGAGGARGRQCHRRAWNRRRGWNRAGRLCYLVSSPADLANWLRPLRAISSFHLASPGDLLDGGTSPIGVLAVLAVAAILLTLATITPQRRDIRD